MLNNQLLDTALKVRQNARPSNSRFAEGAALLTECGEIFTGCNIENVSLGLTICAERAAVAGAVAKGHTDFVAIAVVSDSKESAMPCGDCWQVLAEFNSEMEIIASTIEGGRETDRLDELLRRPKQGIMDPRQNV
jgi:cytidine deaminase